MAVAAETTTQVGGSAPDSRWPLATSASAMMPIVFCASLVPCESEKRLPVTIWPSRKPRDTAPGCWRPTMR
jgi:hypothetical protein